MCLRREWEFDIINDNENDRGRCEMNIMKEEKIKVILYALYSLLGAYVLVDYMRISTTCIVVFLVAGILYYFQKIKMKNGRLWTENKIVHGVFACLASLTIVLCKHMVVNFNEFYSDITTNYIVSFSWKDIIALGILIYDCMLISFVCARILMSERINKIMQEQKTGSEQSFKIRKMLILAGVIFLSWMPYFIQNYPGIIYADSTLSLSQAMGKTPYNNHHPIMYTLFIKLCLYIGSFFGGNTIGVAIYSILQMGLMSIIFAYSVCWLRNKNISKTVCGCVLVFYAMPRFWAQHAVSMWKDPIFSVLVFLFSLRLFDIIYSKGKILKKKRFIIQCILCVFGISLFRNNGIYVVAFSLVMLIFASFVRKGRWLVTRRFMVCMFLSLIVAYIIQGPVYSVLGITSDPVESYGVPLQQVARTVVYDGKMSETEKEFLNNLMPLDKYRENYSPGLVDHFKWSGDFNTEFFNNNQKEFIKVWLSLFKRNPKLYFEAWAMNTCGFWGINYWELNGFTRNLIMGIPKGEKLFDTYQIVAHNCTDENGILQSYFSLRTPIPAIALCLWLALWMIVIGYLKNRTRYLILFIPCIGNILTLMLASPITYWPRYALSFICLLPMCMVFPFIINSARCIYSR